MDPIQNPYAPGAGTLPPELAGRDGLRELVRVASGRVRVGNSAQGVLLVGLRGVGKTVLLEQMRLDAEAEGFRTVKTEAKEDRSLPAVLLPEIRKVLLRLSAVERARALSERALRAMAGLLRGVQIKYDDVTVSVDFEPEPGLADSADLEDDLRDLLAACGEAARAAGTGLLLFADELQYIGKTDFGALISALHGVNQRRLPVLLIGAGLPTLRARAGDAKSYAERLFVFPEVNRLDDASALEALVKPALERGVAYAPGVAEAIVRETQGYAYFLQAWGRVCWDVAPASPIEMRDLERSRRVVMGTLDESFFKVRFDRMTPVEKQYLRAMAELGPGPHRSGDIAGVLGRKVTSVAPTRSSLIGKGMIWSPNHGDTAFTVPLFDEFMRRIMPGKGWGE
jgi:hypothetical protein